MFCLAARGQFILWKFVFGGVSTHPCDSHVNCENEACHLLFIQCESCGEKMQHCCSDPCKEIIQLPIEEQRALRKGTHNSNKIFKKGRSEVLKFKSH